MSENLRFMFERLDSRTDVLAQVLNTVHLGSALSSRVELAAPWALHFAAVDRRAEFHIVAAGHCCIRLDPDVDAVALGPGDMVVLPHGSGHTLADGPATPAIELHDLVADIAPGERITLPGGKDGETATVLCGSYSFAADGINPLLRGLPDLIHLPGQQIHGTPLETAIRLLIDEAQGDGSGTALVIDRLVDLLFVYALRAWIDGRRGADSESWFAALHDPAVGPAVRAVHDDPAHGWTVEELARHASLSRAAFARRFSRTVGESPLNYVTRWRMTIAADLLKRGERIARVAHRVGYENEFAFAKAFKRLRGIAPGQHRRRYAAERAPERPVV